MFLVAQPGRLRVTWHLERRGSDFAIGGGVLHRHEVEIDVQDVGGEQRFAIELDGAALDGLVQQPPW